MSAIAHVDNMGLVFIPATLPQGWLINYQQVSQVSLGGAHGLTHKPATVFGGIWFACPEVLPHPATRAVTRKPLPSRRQLH
jgi:hypothetical protein